MGCASSQVQPLCFDVQTQTNITNMDYAFYESLSPSFYKHIRRQSKSSNCTIETYNTNSNTNTPKATNIIDPHNSNTLIRTESYNTLQSHSINAKRDIQTDITTVIDKLELITECSESNDSSAIF